MLAVNWEAIQAIGTIFGAAATFLAALIALYLGLRKPKKSLSISVNFYEKSHVRDDVLSPDYLILASDLDKNKADERLLGFNVRNNSNEDILLVGFIERARFNNSPRILLKRVRELKRKSISYPTTRGYLSIDTRYGDMPYLFGRPIKIIGKEQKLLCIDYDCLKNTQSSRRDSSLFNMEKPLHFFALDIDGAMYKASFKIPAENFLTEKTCTMRKTHWLD